MKTNTFPTRLFLFVEQLEQRNLFNADLVGVVEMQDEGHDHHADEAQDIRIDELGNAYYLDPIPAIEDAAAQQAAGAGGSGGSNGPAGGSGLNVPALHSNPNANRKIFLDFDGQTISGTLWNNSNGGNPIHAPAYSTDSDIFNYSASEITNIQEIWRRVAEDFAPFNVDVTTEDPGAGAFTAGGQAIRVMISTEYDEVALGGTGNKWFGTAGGVAYLNSWYWTSDTPVWVFENHLGNGNEKYVAEAASHEVGHAFNLRHDGNSSTTYYQGHGSGQTGWAPIMGVGYYRQLSQWSRGEYSNANNTEDDLAKIAAGVGYRADDHGDNSSNATTLTPAADGSVSANGIIEKRTDVDVFAFTTGAGSVSFTISPFDLGDGKANLDVLATIYNSGGQQVAANNPTSLLDATFNLNLAAGTYFLHVDGTGKGTPTTGYSDYGSLGQYDIVGVIVPANSDRPDAVDDSATTQKNQSVLIDVLANDTDPNNDPLTIIAVTNPVKGTAVIESGKIRYTPNSNYTGPDTFTYTIDDGNGGQDIASVRVFVDDPAAIDFSNRTFVSYGGSGQDVNGTVNVADGGKTVTLTGNTWKAISFDFNVTADTIIEFDFWSSAQGEVQGLGLDENLGHSENRTFQVYGTQNWGIRNFDDYHTAAPGVKHYVIPIGQFYTGNMSYLFFANDHDVGNPTAQAVFSNVKVYGQNLPPDAQNDAANTRTNTAVVIDVLANDSDPNGDTLTIVAAGNPTNGTAAIENGKIRYTPNSNFAGQDSFTYTIDDGHSGQDTATVTVTVAANNNPNAVGDSASTDLNQPVSIDVLANDTDGDGDTLTIASVGIASSGTTAIDNGRILYTPNSGFSGQDSFTYTIDDGHSGQDTATVTVTVAANNNPNAVDDSASTDQDQSVLIDVLANDTDADGDTLTIVSVTNGSNGSATTDSGRIRYTPDSGFSGQDSFTYTIDDGNGGQDTATVQVTVRDSGGGAIDFSNRTFLSYGGSAQDVNGNIVVSGGGTTVTLTGNTWKAVAFDYTVTANTVIEFDFQSSAQGEVHGLGLDEDLGLSDNRTFHVYGTQIWGIRNFDNYHTSAPNTKHYVIPVGQFYTGSMHYLFFGNDHDVGNPTAQGIFSNVKIYEQNAPPDAVDDSASTDINTAVVVDVLANDTDANGDTLTITNVSNPANGTAAIENGKIRYTPNSSFTGQDTFTYTVDDGNGGQDTATVSVTVSDPSSYINFSNRTFVSYGGSAQDVNGSVNVSGGGLTVTLAGNTWKAVAFDYTVTANTVIEFDFQSSAQGEVHGLGLDEDLGLSDNRTFHVYGTQAWGIRNFDNYHTSAPNVKHYVIPVGQFYSGSMHYLFFGNDHDVGNPTAQGVFSNIRIYEQSSSAPAMGDVGGFGDFTGGKVTALRTTPDGFGQSLPPLVFQQSNSAAVTSPMVRSVRFDVMPRHQADDPESFADYRSLLGIVRQDDNLEPALNDDDTSADLAGDLVAYSKNLAIVLRDENLIREESELSQSDVGQQRGNLEQDLSSGVKLDWAWDNGG